MTLWNDNVVVLWNIVNDFLKDQDISDNKIIEIINIEFNKIIKIYYNKRFDYDIDELNKFMLYEIHNYIEGYTNEPKEETKQISNMVQTIPQQAIQQESIPKETNIYTNQDLREQKIKETTDLYNIKKQEFDSYNQTKQTKTVSFEDVNTVSNEKIDDILKRVMNDRNYDIININVNDKKKAEQWINNGRDDVKNKEEQMEIPKIEQDNSKALEKERVKQYNKQELLNKLKNKFKQKQEKKEQQQENKDNKDKKETFYEKVKQICITEDNIQNNNNNSLVSNNVIYSELLSEINNINNNNKLHNNNRLRETLESIKNKVKHIENEINTLLDEFI